MLPSTQVDLSGFNVRTSGISVLDLKLAQAGVWAFSYVLKVPLLASFSVAHAAFVAIEIALRQTS